MFREHQPSECVVTGSAAAAALTTAATVHIRVRPAAIAALKSVVSTRNAPQKKRKRKRKRKRGNKKKSKKGKQREGRRGKYQGKDGETGRTFPTPVQDTPPLPCSTQEEKSRKNPEKLQ
jgi:hypothetical protein